MISVLLLGCVLKMRISVKTAIRRRIDESRSSCGIWYEMR